MSLELASNNYGKSAVRLMRVTRSGTQHEVKDLSVDIQLQGDFEAVHTQGDNSSVLPTDTMKNTVYALAAQQPVTEIEEFASGLAAHFLKNNPQENSVNVRIGEHRWPRISAQGKPQAPAFLSCRGERRTAKPIAAPDLHRQPRRTDGPRP